MDDDRKVGSCLIALVIGCFVFIFLFVLMKIYIIQ